MIIFVFIVIMILIPALFVILCWEYQVGASRLEWIIIIIINSDVITLLSSYLLGNLHLSQTVGGIKFSEGKENLPIP
jgi:hypothetical protein